MKLILVCLCWIALLGAASADPLPKGFKPNEFNGSIGPVVADGVVTFRIIPRDCTDIDYGNGETDCLNGSVRNIMYFDRQADLGEAVEYKFDMWVDPVFSYPGFTLGDGRAFGGNGWDSRLRIASWEGPKRKNFIDMIKVDGFNGVAFRYKQCQAPADFGKWVTFSMKVRWANDERGWIMVSCDDKVLIFAEGVVTNEQPHCYYANECDPNHPLKNAKRFFFQLGPLLGGWGKNWRDLYGPTIGPFTVFDEAGITIKMRNISVTTGVELYGPEDKEIVRQLQEKLNALGCDVGKPDGVAGKRTKSQALTCRQFPDMPEAFNVATVRAFLALYSSLEG